MRNKLQSMAGACGLTQVVDKPTRITMRRDGTQTSTCTDHIFTNTAELCSKVVSVPVGCSNHNVVALARRTKMPKPGPKVIMKRSYKNFDELKFREEVSGLCWSDVLMETNPNSALMKFNNVFMKVVEKHAPMKKFTVRSISTPWLDNELKEYMIERNQAKLTANRSNFKSDWQVYCKLRNFVTKLNKKKKKLCYENRINKIKNDSRKVWSTLNSLLGKSHRPTPSFLETEGLFLTKSTETANYLNNYFIKKIKDLRNNFKDMDNESSYVLIRDKIMLGKNCKFNFDTVNISRIENMLRNCKDKPPGIDGLDGKLLKMVANLIAPVICHINSQSLNRNVMSTRMEKGKNNTTAKECKTVCCVVGASLSEESV